MLDVITLTENQHSDMLAWCLTPGEGHGQGDAVIKDFLQAAYREAGIAIYDNKKFFSSWMPGRIRVTSFGSAFVTHEFTVKLKDPEQEDKRAWRLDLFRLWALSIFLDRQPTSDDDKPRYTLRAVWWRAPFDKACGDEAELREHLEAQLPGLKRFGSAQVRRIVLERGLDASAALKPPKLDGLRCMSSLARVRFPPGRHILAQWHPAAPVLG